MRENYTYRCIYNHSCRESPEHQFGKRDNTTSAIQSKVRTRNGVNAPAVFYAETRPPVLWTGKTKCGRVLIWLDGCGRVFFLIFFYSYVSRSPVRRTAQSALQSALHVMLLSYYVGMCVFHERQCDICRRRAYSQGFAKAVHMSHDRQHFDPA